MRGADLSVEVLQNSARSIMGAHRGPLFLEPQRSVIVLPLVTQ